jgi:drug/metabolite transporter (DMT)-like permease
MPLLLLVSLIWAFSPGLIKGRLVGLDSAFISAARLGLALLVFLPVFRWRGLTLWTTVALAGIGAVQFGAMYLAYNQSFHYLPAYEVALFTITTPIFVTLFGDALARTLRPRALAAALAAVAGTALVVVQSTAVRATLAGVALVQLSNVAFAVGQVWYQRLRARQPELRDHQVFAVVYAGGFLVALAAMATGLGARAWSVTAAQGWTLVYLGVLASGIGFFLWNVGATRVTAGTLAVMNNAKIPLMVACSLLFFHESANIPALLGSLAILGGAVWLAGSEPSGGST